MNSTQKRLTIATVTLFATSYLMALPPAKSGGPAGADKADTSAPKPKVTGLQKVPTELYNGDELDFVIAGNGSCEVEVTVNGGVEKLTAPLPTTFKTFAKYYQWKQGELFTQYAISVKPLGSCAGNGPFAANVKLYKDHPIVVKPRGN